LLWTRAEIFSVCVSGLSQAATGRTVRQTVSYTRFTDIVTVFCILTLVTLPGQESFPNVCTISSDKSLENNGSCSMTAILIRKKRGHKTRNFGDSTEDLTKNERLPPVSHIKEDLVLGVLSAGKSVMTIESFLQFRGDNKEGIIHLASMLGFIHTDSCIWLQSLAASKICLYQGFDSLCPPWQRSSSG
jgi:hypothetical protein